MYCPNCNKEYEGKFCQDCGTELVEKPSAGGFNINLGDANAISGGVNLSDSHNVHNEDKSVHNISNVSNVTHNVTNVAAQKTEMELLQEKKSLYLNECKRAYEANVLEQSEIIALEEYRIKIGLDKVTADSILDSVRIMTERNARKTSLNPIAKTKLKILTDNLLKNEVKALVDQIDGLEALVNKYEHDELSRKYFLVLAALKPEKCISLKENSKVDSYWKSFWSYLAYIKVGRSTEAENALMTLDRFADYPEDNITMLGVAGALIRGNTSEAKDYLSAVTGDYTPALQRFVESIYLLLEPAMAKEMSADANTCAFYLVNFFNQEDPKERARKEAEAKAAEEERKRAEEQKRKEEEARRRAAEAEAKRKAEEEACRKAVEETRRREEAERKRKEEEAKANGCAHVSQRVIETSCGSSSNNDFDLTEYESMSLDEQITAAEKLLEFGDKEKSLQGVALFEYIGNNLARKMEEDDDLESLVDMVCVARCSAILRYIPGEASEAFKELKTLADKGCEAAYEPLAEAYTKGLGTNVDADMAMYYALLHRKATEDDNTITPENVVDNLIENMVGGFEHINVFSKNDKYMVCKYLVTQKEWETIMGENPSWEKSPNYPVVNITYAEAEDFVEKVNKIARGKGYEFMIPPTDWQWLGYQKRCAEEFKHLDKDIIRAGVSVFAWHEANSGGHLHNVGELQATVGIYDAAGLVYEMGQTKKYNSYRYGAFNEPIKNCFGNKSSDLMYVDKRYDNLGLRLICMEN